MQEVFKKIKYGLMALAEETYYKSVDGDTNAGQRNSAYHKAIKIVEEIAEEYNNGWIPVSERLPDKAGHEVLATLENGYGQRRVTIIFTGHRDSQWHCNHKEFALDVWKVIAWQPLPEPYVEGGGVG